MKLFRVVTLCAELFTPTVFDQVALLLYSNSDLGFIAAPRTKASLNCGHRCQIVFADSATEFLLAILIEIFNAYCQSVPNSPSKLRPAQSKAPSSVWLHQLGKHGREVSPGLARSRV